MGTLVRFCAPLPPSWCAHGGRRSESRLLRRLGAPAGASSDELWTRSWPALWAGVRAGAGRGLRPSGCLLCSGMEEDSGSFCRQAAGLREPSPGT